MDLLKRHGHSSVNFKELGLYLGLYFRTLNIIEANKRDVRSCLIECLATWLQQRDDVMSVGGPTYDTLIQALRRMGENHVADGIERESKDLVNLFQLDSLCLLPRSLLHHIHINFYHNNFISNFTNINDRSALGKEKP